jgi:cytochrome c1
LTDALNPDWMVQWIRNPQAFDPASLMPNLGVTEAEALALVAYLEGVSRQMTARAGSGAGGQAPPATPQ